MKKWILGLALACPLANAAVIAVEPDDFAVGTNVTTAIPGVHLQHNYRSDGGERAYGPVTVQEAPGCPGLDCRAYTGSRTLGGYGSAYAWDFENNVSGNGYDLLEISFDQVVYDFTIFLTFGGDRPWILGQCLVGFVSGTYGNCTAEIERVYTDSAAHFYRAAITMETASHIIIGGESGYSTIDGFVYNDAATVPEPTTLGLLGLGVAGLVMARRRIS